MQFHNSAFPPFHAIIAVENPDGHEFVLRAIDLDDEVPLFKISTDCRIRRNAESLASAMSLLLKTARTVLFVDPFYSPFNNKFQVTLRACLELVKTAGTVRVCEIHHLDHSSCPTPDAILCNSYSVFRNVIPDGMKLNIYRWREREGGEDFHGRYLLTDKGGIRIDAGFSAEGSHQTTDMNLMAVDLSQSRKRAFSPNSDEYKLVKPVLHIDSYCIQNRSI